MIDRPPVSSADTGLYVHFPYCEKKCPYCDFNSHVQPHDDARYADAILRELERFAPDFQERGALRSIYFGGGTPSLWDPAEVGRVISAARGTLGLVPGAEITLEANPGTVHERLFERFVAAGVNRFSIGAQSFREPELVQLGRIHGASDAARAVRLAKQSGARVSLDLMYAQPGQTWEDVRASIDAALALEPEHISAYTLTIEPDTALGRQHAAGRFEPMEDDAQADLIEAVTAALEAAGHLRYEVSSYAAPGREAVHNTLYWVGGAYLGLGAGAHGYLPAHPLRSAVRRANVKSPDEYIARAMAGGDPTQHREAVDERGVISDRLLTGLRIRWGLDLAALAAEADRPQLEVERSSAMEALIAQGLLARDGRWIAPTPRGFLFADLVARTLLARDP